MTDQYLIQKDKGDVTSQPPGQLQPFTASFFNMPFIRYSMTRTRLSSDGTNTHIEAEEHRYENGTLDSRYFEGTLAGNPMAMMTRIMEQQMNWFFKSISFFMPKSLKP